MATVNYRALQLAIERPIEKACRQAAIALAQEKFNDAKDKFLTDFRSDPVSEEIEAGPKAEATVLPVIGNLFSFIGFEEDDDPIQRLYDFLDENTYMVKTPTYDQATRQYLFKVQIPSKDAIKAVTPMPFGTARSWVFAIESGISGLNQYLSAQKVSEARKGKEVEIGRSTGGIQVNARVSNVAQFTARQYMSKFLNSLAKNIQSK